MQGIDITNEFNLPAITFLPTRNEVEKNNCLREPESSSQKSRFKKKKKKKKKKNYRSF